MTKVSDLAVYKAAQSYISFASSINSYDDDDTCNKNFNEWWYQYYYYAYAKCDIPCTPKDQCDFQAKVMNKIHQYKSVHRLNNTKNSINLQDTIDYVGDLYLLYRNDNMDKISNQNRMHKDYAKPFWDIIFNEMELCIDLHELFKHLVNNRLKQWKNNNHTSLDMDWYVPENFQYLTTNRSSSPTSSSSSTTPSNECLDPVKLDQVKLVPVKLDRVIYKLKQSPLCQLTPISNPNISSPNDEIKCTSYQTLELIANVSQMVPLLMKRRIKRKTSKSMAQLQLKIKRVFPKEFYTNLEEIKATPEKKQKMEHESNIII